MREVRRTARGHWEGGEVSASGDGILQAYGLVAILCESLKVDSYRSGCAVAQQQSLEVIYIFVFVVGSVTLDGES